MRRHCLDGNQSSGPPPADLPASSATHIRFWACQHGPALLKSPCCCSNLQGHALSSPLTAWLCKTCEPGWPSQCCCLFMAACDPCAPQAAPGQVVLCGSCYTAVASIMRNKAPGLHTAARTSSCCWLSTLLSLDAQLGPPPVPALGVPPAAREGRGEHRVRAGVEEASASPLSEATCC